MPIEFPPDDDANAAVQSLLHERDLITDGRSVYGDPRTHRAEQRLLEIDARLQFAETQGVYKPAAPWTPARVAQEQLDAEYPVPPSATLPEAHAEFYRARLDALAALPDARLADLSREVVADLDYRTSRVSFPHHVRNQRLPDATRSVVAGLLDDASAVIDAFARDPKDAERIRAVIVADRPTLEYFAALGQQLGAYSEKRKAFGLDRPSDVSPLDTALETLRRNLKAEAGR